MRTAVDAEVVERAGKGVPEIVKERGWDGFRDLESEVVREAARRRGCVVDTGGGVILRDENVERLRESGTIFWLRADVADIVSRIGGDDQRPSLTGTRTSTDEVQEVLAERTPRYASAAHHQVNTSLLSLEEAVDRIVTLFKTAGDPGAASCGSER
jgi:shikimate kinase